MSGSFAQLDDRGGLKHLITLEGLDRGVLRSILARAERYTAVSGRPAPRDDRLRGLTVANLFAEPSTRTRTSFELAARRLGGDLINLELALSSRAKGESILDTILNLQAMQVDFFVIRDGEAGLPERAARAVDPDVGIVSAGEAHLSHPTQGLLDALTILQCKGRFDGLVVAIAGDIRRSRVARSAYRALSTLGVAEIRIAGPGDMMPPATEFAGARRFDSLDAAIDGADVVMMLRIQRERVEDGREPDLAAYHRDFGLTTARLVRAKDDAIVMHPGPMNRGVEIDSDVADGPRSVIRRQVANGVAVRMAVLAELAEARRMRAP